jgi:molybdopterin-guanine dinucleotide biosynthesis protein
MTKVVMIGGKKRSGKGSATEYLKKLYETQGFTVAVVSIASTVKEIIADLFGISVEDVEKYKNAPTKYWVEAMDTGQLTLHQTDFRRLLQLLGTDIRNKYLGQNFWVRVAVDKITATKADIVLVDDWRFPFEYEEVLKEFPTKTLIILRDSETKDTHSSETALDDFVADYTVRNSGTLEDFFIKLEKLQHLLR